MNRLKSINFWSLIFLKTWIFNILVAFSHNKANIINKIFQVMKYRLPILINFPMHNDNKFNNRNKEIAKS